MALFFDVLQAEANTSTTPACEMDSKRNNKGGSAAYTLPSICLLSLEKFGRWDKKSRDSTVKHFILSKLM